MTDIAIHHTFVDGPNVLTWFDLHTTVAPPCPTANWSHIEDGKITAIRVTFDARPLPPQSSNDIDPGSGPNQPTPERSHPMRTRTTSRAGRIFHRVKEIWAELDYAQRRTLEIRTGIPLTQQANPDMTASVSDLESLYALEDHDGLSDRHASPARIRPSVDRRSRQAGSRQRV